MILNPHRSSLLNFSKLARLFHRVKRRTWSPESPSGFYPPCSFYCDLICSLPEFLILREALPNHAILSNTTTWELLWVPSQVSLQSEILFFFFKFSLKKKTTLSGAVCDVLLVSGIQQSDSVLYTHIHIFS